MYQVISFITGSKGENETLQSNFETGTHISYALGRVQQQLRAPLTELAKQEQAARMKLADVTDIKSQEYKDTQAELDEDIKSLRSARSEYDLFGWRLSKLKSNCQTIPPAWWWTIELVRVDEEIDWLKKVEVTFTRSELMQCYLTLRELGQSDKSNKKALYNFGNQISVKIAMTLKSLDGFAATHFERAKELREKYDGLKPDSDEAKAIDKEFGSWMNEKVSVNVYQWTLNDLPDECETIPSDAFQSLTPVIAE